MTSAKTPAKKPVLLDEKEKQSWIDTINNLWTAAEKKKDKGEKLIAFNSLAEHARWKKKQLDTRREQYVTNSGFKWMLGSAALMLFGAGVGLVASVVALPAAVGAVAGIAVAAGGVGIFATSSVKGLFLNRFNYLHSGLDATLETTRKNATAQEETIAALGYKAFIDSKASHLLERRFPELKEEFLKKVAKKAAEVKAAAEPAKPVAAPAPVTAPVVADAPAAKEAPVPVVPAEQKPVVTAPNP